MANLIAWIYAFWQQIPAGFRAGVSAFAAVLVGAVFAFNWTLPGNWAGAVKEITLFWVFVVPIAVAAFRKSIWPPLFAWILSLLGLAVTIDGRGLVKAWKAA